MTEKKTLIKYASDNRKEMPEGERKLWYTFLRYLKPRFYRQYIIGNYIADFCCPKMNLIIEVDGSQHYDEDAIDRDRIRTEALNKFGYVVMRFSTDDIRREFKAVCNTIENYVLG